MSPPDPIVATVGMGLCASVVAGKGLVRLLELFPHRWRRATQWLVIGGAASIAILGGVWPPRPGAETLFVFVLAALPGTVAFLAWRTVVASVLVSLLPLYYAIGALTAGRTLHMPAIALDRALPVEPAWMLVYGSLYVFVLLPLLVVRQGPLFRRALQAYLMVLIVSYIGFLLYPTVAPRPAVLPADGFFAWCLRVTYSLDSPYNCFPSLHVADSFVSAFTCYRVNRRVGVAAAAWASLIGVSTLFAKQHFVVDVVAGVLLASVAYVAFLRTYPREAVPEDDRRRAPLLALGGVAIFIAMLACFWLVYQMRVGVLHGLL